MKLIFIGVYLVLTVCGVVFMKLGGNPGSFAFKEGTLSFGIHWISAIGFVCYIASFLLFTRIVVMYDLSYIYPIITGIVQIATLVISAFVFKEQMSLQSVVGAALIIIGIIVMNFHKS